MMMMMICNSLLWPTKQKEKGTTYNVEVVCLIMEIEVFLIEPKYEQHNNNKSLIFLSS